MLTLARFLCPALIRCRLFLALAAVAAAGSAGVGCGGGSDCVDACAKRCQDEAKNNCPRGRFCICDATPCFKACGYN